MFYKSSLENLDCSMRQTEVLAIDNFEIHLLLVAQRIANAFGQVRDAK